MWKRVFGRAEAARILQVPSVKATSWGLSGWCKAILLALADSKGEFSRKLSMNILGGRH